MGSRAELDEGRPILVFVAATANAGKLKEMRAALLGVAEVLPRPPGMDAVAETGETFEENARLKAEAVLKVVVEAAVARATRDLPSERLPVLAEDSGLEVDALGGVPGVYSSRYAGANADDLANVEKLLKALKGVPSDERTARFRAVVVAKWPNGEEVLAEGTVEGEIARTPRGEGGFGYDPVFVPTHSRQTFAEMSLAQKTVLSHRGRALEALTQKVRQVGFEPTRAEAHRDLNPARLPDSATDARIIESTSRI